MSESAVSSSTPARPRRRGWAGLLLLVLVAGLLAWAWRQPFALTWRTLWEVSRLPPASTLPVPVEGVRARAIADTFGAPRGRDRTHAGVDIFAARGTPITSSTRGVVVAVRDGGLGGRQVWVLGPARERYYYAHLQDWAPALAVGDVVDVGTTLGSVGTSGNARGTPPHLHFGVYGREGAYDPLPLLRVHAAVGQRGPAR
ncbi:M23 family metallopeptidase [Pseudoxanthomonas indica]|uniref:Peptidase family M23 n=1 Tax=Pseudoxanthomonas indica TaxID=428993 RepID=A0A1T5LLU8_9GAMM|nr:M23 family metallopeptidase [Pseudoxanthomonas indica]GGD36691.1 peptidase [Pseudoxanthomonas indica]SKC76854.1 Peptidase family M23 [Pseudoxanthomonas indica]